MKITDYLKISQAENTVINFLDDEARREIRGTQGSSGTVSVTYGEPPALPQWTQNPRLSALQP